MSMCHVRVPTEGGGYTRRRSSSLIDHTQHFQSRWRGCLACGIDADTIPQIIWQAILETEQVPLFGLVLQHVVVLCGRNQQLSKLDNSYCRQRRRNRLCFVYMRMSPSWAFAVHTVFSLGAGYLC